MERLHACRSHTDRMSRPNMCNLSQRHFLYRRVPSMLCCAAEPCARSASTPRPGQPRARAWGMLPPLRESVPPPALRHLAVPAAQLLAVLDWGRLCKPCATPIGYEPVLQAADRGPGPAARPLRTRSASHPRAHTRGAAFGPRGIHGVSAVEADQPSAPARAPCPPRVTALRSRIARLRHPRPCGPRRASPGGNAA
jgi:hypothetical protein